MYIYIHLPSICQPALSRCFSKAKVESKEPPSYLLYVQRAQSRAERKAALEEERSCLARKAERGQLQGEKGEMEKKQP